MTCLVLFLEWLKGDFRGSKLKTLFVEGVKCSTISLKNLKEGFKLKFGVFTFYKKLYNSMFMFYKFEFLMHYHYKLSNIQNIQEIFN